jgi:hypothetical protein
MSSSQGVSRGFHRLGLFLASIILVIGSWITILLPDWSAPFPTKWTFGLVTRQPMPEWTNSDTGNGPIINIGGTFGCLATTTTSR